MLTDPDTGEGLSISLWNSEEDMQWAQEMLDGQVRQIEEESGVKVTKAYLREGEPDAEVVSLAEEIGASMIVAGSRGLGRLRGPHRERLQQHRGSRPLPGAGGQGNRASIAGRIACPG